MPFGNRLVINVSGKAHQMLKPAVKSLRNDYLPVLKVSPQKILKGENSYYTVEKPGRHS